MKRIAIIFIPIILAFHFPQTPQNLVPHDWVSEFEDGKQWAQLFLSFYRSQTAESSPGKASPKAETEKILQPLVVRSVAAAQALAPALNDLQQMQVEHSVEKCELTVRKVQIKILQEQALPAAMRTQHERALHTLERLKDLQLSQKISFERLRVIHFRLPGRPA